MVKGLDTVRSSFPTAMREMLGKLLEDILFDTPTKKTLDVKIDKKFVCQKCF